MWSRLTHQIIQTCSGYRIQTVFGKLLSQVTMSDIQVRLMLCQASMPALSSGVPRSSTYYLRLTVILQHGQTGLAQHTPGTVYKAAITPSPSLNCLWMGIKIRLLYATTPRHEVNDQCATRKLLCFRSLYTNRCNVMALWVAMSFRALGPVASETNSKPSSFNPNYQYTFSLQQYWLLRLT